jgi:hypothetical protein
MINAGSSGRVGACWKRSDAAFEGRCPGQYAGFRPPFRKIRADDHGQLRQPVAHRLDFGEVLAVGDQRPRAAVGQPVLQRVRAEEGEERHGDRAHLVDRDVGYGGLGTLRQKDADPVAPAHPLGRQGVGERRMISKKVYSWICPAASS